MFMPFSETFPYEGETFMAEQEKFYDIYRNEEGGLLFAISDRGNEPQSPKIIYDGGQHALLYRTPEKVIVLDYVHPDIRDELKETPQVLIVEADSDDIIREYEAPVRHVKNLPPFDLELEVDEDMVGDGEAKQ